MKKIYYYPPAYSYGAKVIVENFMAACQRQKIELELLEELDDSSPEDEIIPQGVKKGIEVLRRGFHTHFILLGDAMSLGYYNKMKFYIKIGHIFHKDFIYSIYGYLRYRREEKKILNNYSDVVLYSQADIEFLKKLAPNAACRYLCIPNGIYEVGNAMRKKQTGQVVLGLMSSWGSFQSYEENNWFIRNYFRKYVESHPNVRLIIAGRGSYTKKLIGLNNVDVVGEVDNLGDFFEKIDFFLSVNPKGCGILNRVLDSIVYRVPVIGNNASFSGFQDSDSIFLRFNNYSSFCDAIDFATNHRDKMEEMSKNAYEYALRNNDWNRNYNFLVGRIVDKLNKEKDV